MNCTFCGHGNRLYDNHYDKFKFEIKKLIEFGVTTFYNGGYGNFDKTCLRAVKELKVIYPYIKSYIVLAYRDSNHIEKHNYIYKYYNAETIYTLEYAIHPKYAVTARNKWMVDNSDYMIAYVTNSYGGAYANFKYAKRKNSNITQVINIADVD